MRNIFLFTIVIFINSCKAQVNNVKSINDKRLVENIVSQFSEKAKIKSNTSFFALYFQENPKITEVKDNKKAEYIYNGLTITIYKFESKNQINEFNKDFDIYVKSGNIFCIFDKNSNPELLKTLKTKKLPQSNAFSSNDGYDPKSWVLSFNNNGDLEKCYPYKCN